MSIRMIHRYPFMWLRDQATTEAGVQRDLGYAIRYTSIAPLTEWPNNVGGLIIYGIGAVLYD